MFKKGQKWYRIEDVAEEYEDSRFSKGGKVLDKKEREYLLSLLEPDGKDILDIATGTGRFAEALSEKGAEVVGLDASREMLKQSRVESVQSDALKLPFKDDCFDLAVSMRFLHLLDPPQIKNFVSEVGRVTKEKFVFESLHPFSLRMLYQWALPQGSRLYSNSFLKEELGHMPEVEKVRSHERFVVPYGIYQLMPLDLAEELIKVDEKISEEEKWLASTIYWEVYF
ncbi:MAG: methyltransferase domain-containing protein [Candidatus Aenigmatarchaeota archaeon]